MIMRNIKTLLCPKTITISLFVTGNLIGAGILALPINTGIAGFIPTLWIMALLSFAMYFSAITVASQISEEKNPLFNFASFYRQNLGRIGQFIAVFTNIFILYGYLTAYITGISVTLTNVFDLPISRFWMVTLVFLSMTLFCLKGAKIAAKFNVLFMLFIWGSFAYLISVSSGNIHLEYLTRKNWTFIPMTAPIILTTYYFHSIIPNICHELDWNRKKINVAILGGVLIGFIMCFSWLYVGLGIIPFNGSELSLVNAYQQGLPATVPMTKIIGNSHFLIGSLIFAIFAILTSYITNGLGLLGLFQDVSVNYWNIKNRYFPLVITLLPPYLISLFFPNVFLKTLDIAGGVGTSILFGILPFIVGLKKGARGYKKILFIFILLIFITTLLVELSIDFHLFKISPSYESWDFPLLQKFFNPIGSNTHP